FDQLFGPLQLRTWMCILLIERRQRFGLVQASHHLDSRDELFCIFLLRQVVGADRGMLSGVSGAQRETTTALRSGRHDDNGIALAHSWRDKERGAQQLEVWLREISSCLHESDAPFGQAAKC